MKKYLLLLSLTLLLYSCKEDGPFIDLTPPKAKVQGDTDYVASALATPQLHNVLIEDITGVKCISCPASHDAATSISNANPGRIVIAALHTWYLDVYTNPSGGFPDFRDSSANYIVTQLLDNPNGIPNGGINRKLFSGELKRYYLFSKWTAFVNQELLLPSPINIGITNTYNTTTREVTAEVKMECTQNIPNDLYLSVGITENGIIGKQKDPTTTIEFYTHNHVLRKMLTPDAGLKVNSPSIVLDAKKVVIRVFKYTLPVGWNASNCNVIGIVHNNSSVIDVVQCTEKKIL